MILLNEHRSTLRVCVLLYFVLPLAVVQAQRTDTLPKRVPVVAADSMVPRTGIQQAGVARPSKPPMSSRRAFLTSLAVPGLSQAKLQRATAGAFFATIEFGSLAMLRKSYDDLQEARKFSRDSMPADYTIGTDAKVAGTGTFGPRLPTSLVRPRRLHVEDWIAALAFNHLLSAADAFVSAQLWDVPAVVGVRPAPAGVALVASIRW